MDPDKKQEENGKRKLLPEDNKSEPSSARKKGKAPTSQLTTKTSVIPSFLTYLTGNDDANQLVESFIDLLMYKRIRVDTKLRDQLLHCPTLRFMLMVFPDLSYGYKQFESKDCKLPPGFCKDFKKNTGRFFDIEDNGFGPLKTVTARLIMQGHVEDRGVDPNGSTYRQRGGIVVNSTNGKITVKLLFGCRSISNFYNINTSETQILLCLAILFGKYCKIIHPCVSQNGGNDTAQVAACNTSSSSSTATADFSPSSSI